MTQPMKILIVGSGGREHAIAWALARTSARPVELFCAPGNAGIEGLATCVSISATDIVSLANFAEEKRIDLTVVGGETPLAAGIVDLFESRGMLIAGPRSDAARLESSKTFAKDFMARHGVPTARYRIATSPDEAIKILRSGEFGGEESPVVVKADGLAAGKGVVVATSRNEAEHAIREIMEGGVVDSAAAGSIVLEELLTGVEASLLLFTDGNSIALMPAARDHKRIGEGDTGPNTGGMGAITSPEILDQKTLDRAITEIVGPTLAGARSEGFAFRGVLFVGLMLTATGPKVLEYNVRFGDPETQAILVRLDSDLATIFEAIARGDLTGVPVQWAPGSSACVVLAAEGYPAKPRTGSLITGLDRISSTTGVNIFHAGTARSPEGDWLTASGRVLGVTSKAPVLEEALARCYASISEIKWEGMQFRRDIGQFAAI
jgi:phosphoribosylamine--glycine ligase